MFLGKVALKICSEFTGEHSCQSVVLTKLLRNFIEVALPHGHSPVNLLHISRAHFPKNTSKVPLLFISCLQYPRQQISLKIYMLYLFLGKSKHRHRKKTIHYKLVPFESVNELFMNPLKKKYYWRSFSFSNFDAEKKCPIRSPKYFYRDRISTFLWFCVFKQNDILTSTFHYKLDYLRYVIQHGLSLEGSDLLTIP